MKSIIFFLTFVTIAFAPCSSYCNNCLFSTCRSCISKYYLSNNQCKSCPTGCKTCSNASYCSNCTSSYYLSSNLCLSCVYNCISCLNSTSCQTCFNNYVFYSSLSACASTKCNPISCQTCKTYSTCSLCQNGYIISGESCIQCPNTCQKCSSNICQSCIASYYLYKDSCYPCLTNCLTCTDNKTCTICNEGYSITNENSTTKCQKYQTKSSTLSKMLFIVLPTIFSIAVLLFIAYCIYKYRNQDAQEEIAVESMDRIFPSELNWKPYQREIDWEEEICPICLDNFVEVQTNCKHLFHVRCVLGWCLPRKTCPFCRQIVREVNYICTNCKKSYMNVSLEQAKNIRDVRCDECLVQLS